MLEPPKTDKAPGEESKDDGRSKEPSESSAMNGENTASQAAQVENNDNSEKLAKVNSKASAGSQNSQNSDETVDLSDMDLEDSIYIHKSHGVPTNKRLNGSSNPIQIPSSNTNSQTPQANLHENQTLPQKTLVKKDSGYSGPIQQQATNEKRIKKLKKLQKNERQLGETKFFPPKIDPSDKTREKRRLKFADDTGGVLFEVSLFILSLVGNFSSAEIV
uniref:Uncharacterized protein n=1 Tax=Mucochytrium quahogii TaxID=96639 RepID=A0A7S2RQ63_9STRA|mmetsp:Transcript_39197/g.63612  ORF Transcript_39197/g.63612 Transcript_39197/m.63612 type:complete len:218 (+) Transcript_39197:1730-2383(+)